MVNSHATQIVGKQNKLLMTQSHFNLKNTDMSSIKTDNLVTI